MRVDWGDAPAWAALVISAVAVVLATRGQRRSNAAADRSALASERSVAASERSAVAAEQAVAIQAQQVAEASAAAAPKVELVIQRGSGSAYLLRNVGQLAATGIVADLAAAGSHADDLPAGIDLVPKQAFKMILEGSFDTPALPDELWLRWDGQPDFVAVPMPR